MTKPKKFILNFLISCGIFSFIIIFFNVIVNPYSIFPSNVIEIEKKPAALIHVRMHKAHAIKKIKPKTIILGTSRAAIGIDPHHPAFRYEPVYNLGLDGANMYELLRYFEHARHINELKEVIFLIDFMTFNAFMKNKPDFDEYRLINSPTNKTYEKELFACIFSYSATLDSLKTLLQKFDKTLPSLNNHGLIQEKALISYKELEGGAYATSLSSEKTYAREVYSPFDFSSTDFPESTFTYFNKLIEQCYQHDIKLTIIIPPFHARHSLLIDSLGLWEKYEKWKSLLVDYNEKIAHLYKRAPFSVWDFSHFNSYTTTPFYTNEQDKTSLKWYWETSHFNKKFGNHMLNEIFLNKKQPLLGINLTSQNIDAELKKNYLQKENFKKKYPLITKEIIALADQEKI